MHLLPANPTGWLGSLLPPVVRLLFLPGVRWCERSQLAASCSEPARNAKQAHSRPTIWTVGTPVSTVGSGYRGYNASLSPSRRPARADHGKYLS